MKNNINNFPVVVELGDVFYECDFDHKSIDVLETILGTGFYEVYEKFVFKNNLSSKDTINLISVSAFKNHGATGMQRAKCTLIAHPEIDLTDLATLKTHFKNLLPNMIEFQKDLKCLNPNSSTKPENNKFYDFEDSYALAKNFLNWSDEEFWSSTPKKLCFALISLAKYNKQVEKFEQKKQTENCINFLNGIKKML
jgi:hypothetical protein